MKKLDLKTLNISQLVDRYIAILLRQYAVRHHTYDDGRPDVRPWNKLGHEVEALHRELKSRGDDGVDALLPLIYHPNPNVRYSSIVDCLRQRTTQVLPALEKEAQNNDWRENKVDFQSALEMWREGKWIVD